MRAGIFLACWPWFSPGERLERSVLDRLTANAEAGIDTLICVPCGPDRPAIVRALAGARVA